MASTINADTGVVSGITGIVQTADATGNLTLQANGVSVLTVDTSLKSTFSGNIILGTSGRIGIGTATPDVELNILANPQTVSYQVTGNSTTTGTDLHISGADGVQTRITQDAFGANTYVAFTGRTSRGTAATPTQTLSGDTIAQFTGRGFSNGTLQFGNASTGRLDVVAAENFTDTSRATNVQIFTTAASSVTPTAIATFSSANGLSVAGNVTATTITETSSIQFKENIRPLSNPLLAISQLAGVTYDRRDGTSKDEIGLIAEEVYQVIPELVSLDEHGRPYGIKYTKLTAYLIECIKDLQTQIDQLKKDQ